MKTPRPGDIVKILFTDHVMNMEELEADLVFGRIHRITPTAIFLDSWAREDPLASRDLGNTVESFGIHRKSIHQMWRVKTWEEM